MELLKRFSFTLLLMTLTTLVACGGGGGGLSIDDDSSTGGSGVTDPDTTIVVDSITLLASSQQLASSGAQVILLTAIAKDANNNLLSDVEISFQSTSGSIENINSVTGNDGKATVNLKTESNHENRIITAKAISGDSSASIDIQVIGTSVNLTGSSSLSINDANNFIVKVLDSDGDSIANTEVILSLSNTSTTMPAGDIASINIPSSIFTDSIGQAIVVVTGTSGGTNTIIASALGATTEQKVAVQADSFLFTSFDNGNTSVNPSINTILPDVKLDPAEASVTLTWLRSGVAVDDGTKVNFSTTRGTLSADSGTTINGMVTTTVSSNDAGKALVTFVGTDSNIELSNQVEFEFFADTAATLKAQASPNSIGTDNQTSTISVVVRDVNGNLVKGKAIKFTVDDISGGAIFPATAITDSDGSASTVYTSSNTSAQNGVAITATVIDTPSILDTVTLTVADRELFISLGTGNELEEYGTTDYIKEYSAFVTDADSNPVANKEITVSAVPHKYYKGYWIRFYDEGGSFVRWGTRGADASESNTSPGLSKKQCNNEDVNFDGILDSGEDFNGDTELTPGNIVAALGTVTTDDDGRAVIRITYPQSYGSWLDIKLIASVKVGGSENSTQTIFTLTTLADDILDEDISPPTQGIHLRGPFGLLNDCSLNIADDPA